MRGGKENLDWYVKLKNKKVIFLGVQRRNSILSLEKDFFQDNYVEDFY